MHFIVYSNFNRDSDIAVVEKVVAYLKTKKGVSYTLASFRDSGFLGHSFVRLSDCVREADALIVIGGDGTVLRATSDVANARLSTPILAINRGQCGFLTDIEPAEIDIAIDKFLKGDYVIDTRSMLQATFKDKTFFALNEVCIYKGDITHPIVAEARYNDDKVIAAVQADGGYVCTPTGSTAYSLSCGGPIVAPDSQVFVLGAICAHTLVNRPYVLPDTTEISLALGKEYSDARLLIDGEVKARIYDHTPIVVKKAEIAAHFIKTKEVDFYKKLLGKLNRWNTTVYCDSDKEDS